MVTLICAVVGTAGSAFSVRVDERDSVDDLKNAIATTQKYDFAASTLQLYKNREGRRVARRRSCCAATRREGNS
ncbi:TPA: hypothetical protein N0F65_002687 [Lagenidium giganteum]|uniref:Crinkler effector protein N-terminal domain-containing protein n=1 Tax=Lagenidium giganteum TaxID=4803 RepID=A0AAV2Z6J9_9STRA|nr:TPA: hypothetical protein N0F65_002687 [Lagenidium giganteum]